MLKKLPDHFNLLPLLVVRPQIKKLKVYTENNLNTIWIFSLFQTFSLRKEKIVPM